MIEVEIRGKLEPGKFKTLFELFSKDGKMVDHYQRVSVDISADFDEKTRMWPKDSPMDIRIKKSDDKEKITVKIGHFNEISRREVEVKLYPGEFLNALDLFAVLGYKTGMIYAWESWEFDYEGYEVKLSKYSDSYFTFEIEGKENKDVEKLAKQLDLQPYTLDEYRKAIDWENQAIHQLYTREKVAQMIKERF